ncbi:DNA-directed RNA polymerase I subunit RPA34.5-domain-containing protein [Aspergillus avenaceus]|uniref:DNA-directed RNA polymerase I subunit RPA34.5-domain-containing protein n=1 Tax=Aspergillus avenaceus TaxID=36643 RepID=A0A5N6TMH6_ASPAV|nr:DNA-directed RNA polymerase I subunit RPA34.5-domain-containing protein [Aspergillus avenaceus]
MAPTKDQMSTSSDGDSRSNSPEVSKKQEAESSSDSSSDSDNESSASEEQSKQSKAKKVSFQAQPYKPPSGFKAAKKQTPPSSANLLNDLRGKQVFHITAPSSLPLSKVKEVSWGKVLQGQPVLKHEGVHYGIPVESIGQGDQGNKTLVLYDSKSQTYYTTANSNIQSYHIQELINLPERSEDNDPALEAAKEQIKPPRKQPKHLKMRFRPVGSEQGPAETIGSDSEESEEEQPTFKAPKELRKEKEERKRKHHQTDGEGTQPSGEPRKKSKHQSEGDDKAEKPKKSSKSKEEKKRKKADKAA